MPYSNEQGGYISRPDYKQIALKPATKLYCDLCAPSNIEGFDHYARTPCKSEPFPPSAHFKTSFAWLPKLQGKCSNCDKDLSK